jgi:subtilisin family serine protease
VLVVFNQEADLTMASTLHWPSRGEYVYEVLLVQAEHSQGRAMGVLEARGLQYRSFFTSNILYVFEADLDAIDRLVILPEVSRISLAREYTLGSIGMGNSDFLGSTLELLASGHIIGPDQSLPDEMSWAVIDTHADQFWTTYGFAGEGIVVASIDTGVQWDHPALVESYKCRLNPGDPACWYDPSGSCPLPCDGNGHGTATMGPITGENGDTVPHQVGMAPEAQWIACKGCTDGGSCSDYSLLACADWVMAPGGNPANQPHLVNNAWGGMGNCDSWFDQAINNWLTAGIAITFAAGGGGPGCATMGSPADHFEVFTCAAHDINRLVAYFSARGPSTCPGGDQFAKPNMSAPGVNIQVPVPTGGWQEYDGTSFSNSYGSGALALLMSCAPWLVGNPYALYDALQEAADPPPDGNCLAPPDGDGNFTYGHGYINMLTAGEMYCGAAGVVYGYITDQVTSTPIDGAVITATLTTDPLVQHTTSSYGGGYYDLTLLVGTYTMTATYPDYLPGMAIVEILTDTWITQDFALVPESPAMGWIDGIVSDQSNGMALAGAEITATLLSEPPTWITTTTDTSGYYTMTLEAGIYELRATYPDFLPGIATVEVMAGTVTPQDFILEWVGTWKTALPIILKN